MVDVPFVTEEERAKFVAVDASVATNTTGIATLVSNETADDAAQVLLQAGFFDLTATANKETSTATSSALSVVKMLSLIDSTTGAGSRTIAAPGATSPLVKIIRMSVDGGDTTIVGTNILGRSGTTATFGDAGDTLVLVNNGTIWVECSLSQGGVTWA